MVALQILTVIGAVSLFLFGMRLMSEALQKLAGDRFRNILATITSNRVKGIATGFIVTAGIQSSSAVTVMIVSFVNAGLLTLSESFLIIMGANIGTTVTGWIVAFLGFRFDLTMFLLPLLAISLPLSYFSSTRVRSWGEFLIGFSILFLGLNFLKESMPLIGADSEILHTLSNLPAIGFSSLLMFAGIGFVTTLLFQSSSAVMTLTFVVCSKGWITYEAAAAIVLGLNVGTAITANIAAIVANRTAKRSALLHLLFNLLGVIWALVFFTRFLHLVTYVTILTGTNSPYYDILAIPMALSLLHTSFNIINTLLFTLLAKQMIRLSELLIPLRKDEEDVFRLRHMRQSFLSTSELSLVQARKEVEVYGARIKTMFEMVPELLMEKRPAKYSRLHKKIMKYEDIADNMEIEIANYLTKISESELSSEGTRKLRLMLKIIDDIESIGDECKEMADVIDAKNRQNVWFTQEMRNNLFLMFDKINHGLTLMCSRLARGYAPEGFSEAETIENEINTLKEQLQDQNRESIEKGDYAYQNGMYYSELLRHCEKAGDFIFNVHQAVTGVK